MSNSRSKAVHGDSTSLSSEYQNVDLKQNVAAQGWDWINTLHNLTDNRQRHPGNSPGEHWIEVMLITRKTLRSVILNRGPWFNDDTETTQKRKTHQYMSAANYHTTAKNAGVLYTKDPTTEAPPHQALCIRWPKGWMEMTTRRRLGDDQMAATIYSYLNYCS